MGIYEDFYGVPTGNICDSYGGKGAMDSGMVPLDRHMYVCGRALTVACAAGDNLTIHKAVLEAQEGDVLVINCGGYTHAGAFGEMLALSCVSHGIKGVILDGSCRDKNELIEMNFPTFARGTSPEGTIKETCGAVGGTVVCGGVQVHTGDVVVGDCDGVVVIARADVDKVLAGARAKKEKEDAMRPILSSGGTTAELLGLMEKLR